LLQVASPETFGYKLINQERKFKLSPWVVVAFRIATLVPRPAAIVPCSCISSLQLTIPEACFSVLYTLCSISAWPSGHGESLPCLYIYSTRCMQTRDIMFIACVLYSISLLLFEANKDGSHKV
jgi:hypothetical protein